jgi:hypothetical protein
LQPVAGIPPFVAARERVRKVQADCAIEVDGNAYSVPWRLIGERVRVILAGEHLRVSHAGQEVAVPQRCAGRLERRVDPLHFARCTSPAALRRRRRLPAAGNAAHDAGSRDADPERLRSRVEYERLAGGRW